MTSKGITVTSLVCFIVCDGGPAAHFATFASTLLAQYQLQSIIYATGPAWNKMNDSNLPLGIQLVPFVSDDLDRTQEEQVATQLIDGCLKQGARHIITDLGNKFDPVLQAAASKYDLSSGKFRSWCYYDNPESYVPGGYSTKADETITASKGILFANMNLAQVDSKIYSLPGKDIDLTNKTVQGIGYYPVTDVEKLRRQRAIERDSLRAENDWSNVQHLFVYFGGNNEEYFEKALPAFLFNLAQLDKTLLDDIFFLFQQHPAAKKLNRDGLLLQEWRSKDNHVQIRISTLKNSDQAQIVADAALYYQTSMAPQFALLDLPIMQVGHEVYEDILVKHQLCHTATNSIELARGFTEMKRRTESLSKLEERQQLIYNSIGYTSNWSENLHRIIFEHE